MELKNRVYSKHALSMKENEEVVVAGWVSRYKDIGKVAFIHLRDREGAIQITVKNDSPFFEKIKELSVESVITVKGKLVKGQLKSGDMEIVADEIEIISLANSQLPLDMTGHIESKSETRFDSRYMDLRRPEIAAFFRIRSQVSASIREFLTDSEFIEVHTPKIAGAGAEGGATLFELKYYNQKAYLNQSQQLYKQMLMAAGFDRVFEIGPSFRAEKSHTRRHLSEFTQLDVEMAFIDSEEAVLEVIEKMFVKVLTDVNENCKDELDILKRKVKVPKLPFKRVTYEEALEILEKNGRKLNFGDDIGTEDEKLLGDLIEDEFYFLTKWPYETKPFYIKTDEEISRGFDLEWNGQEIISGGQREENYKILLKQVKEKGLNEKDFNFYLNAFKHGIPTHGGFGMGIDRLVMQITGAENVREVNLFPRTPERVLP